MSTSPRILVVDTYYPEFLKKVYSDDPSLGGLPYVQQLQRLFETGFGVSDAYPHFLKAAGCEAAGVICNADALQECWAREHRLTLVENIHDRRRQIVAAQIDAYRPDVLYVFEWCPLGDAFLKQLHEKVRLIVGQIASPLPPNRTFASFHLMISSWPPIVDYFRSQGQGSEILRLGFDPRVVYRLTATPKKYDATFVGGFAPSHPDRVVWLERLLREVDVTIFGYGADKVAPESPIHQHHGGEAWGWRMYEVLQESRVTLNRHAWIDVRGKVATHLATNMRLYESTGVGTCLVTEHKENLPQLFEPGREVITYSNDDDCVEQVKQLLADHSGREQIAKAGQTRTLAEHGYDQRMKELADILRKNLR